MTKAKTHQSVINYRFYYLYYYKFLSISTKKIKKLDQK